MNANLMRQMNELFGQVTTTQELRLITDMYKSANRRIQMLGATQFYVGQSVKFRDKRGMTVEGKVTKVNGKTISVTADGAAWRISPSLLSAA